MAIGLILLDRSGQIVVQREVFPEEAQAHKATLLIHKGVHYRYEGTFADGDRVFANKVELDAVCFACYSETDRTYELV